MIQNIKLKDKFPLLKNDDEENPFEGKSMKVDYEDSTITAPNRKLVAVMNSEKL